jgi:hypothetical protein
MRPVGLLVGSALFGSWAFSILAAPLNAEDAAGHIGETAAVCGVVASAEYEANAQSRPTLLDLGRPSPKAVFTAMIYGMDRAKFHLVARIRRLSVLGRVA